MKNDMLKNIMAAALLLAAPIAAKADVIYTNYHGSEIYSNGSEERMGAFSGILKSECESKRDDTILRLMEEGYVYPVRSFECLPSDQLVLGQVKDLIRGRVCTKCLFILDLERYVILDPNSIIAMNFNKFEAIGEKYRLSEYERELEALNQKYAIDRFEKEVSRLESLLTNP